MLRAMILALAALALAQSGQATEQHHGHAKPYGGQQNREIKSLSAADLAELRRGGGWGLAKAAELNGVPGPAHLLELKEAIPLNPDQVDAITKLFDAMRAQAVKQGAVLIAAERALDRMFRDGSATEDRLRQALDAVAQARRDLRFIHLATHLKTPAILTAQQIDRYNALRGYGQPDPCSRVPTGHDPVMWRKHNGCD